MKNLRLKAARAVLDMSQQDLADGWVCRGKPSMPSKRVTIIPPSSYA